MTLQEFINKWNGKIADFDNYAGGQCTDLARFYWKEVCEISQPRSVGGAKDFWTNFETDPNLNQNFEKIPNTPEGIPEAGDVMIWGSKYGTYGHIAIVTQADVNTFTCFSQNDPSGALCGLKTYKAWSTLLGWFKPKKQETMYKGYDLTNKDSMKVAVDALTDLVSGELIRKAEVDNLNKKITDLETSLKSLEERLSSIEGIIAIKDEQLEFGAEEKALLIAENQKLVEDIEYYKPYKSRYEDALKKVPSSLTGTELIILGIGKLLTKLKDKWKSQP